MQVAPSAPAPRRAIQVRSPKFDFEAVPRHWFNGSAVATHLANGLNLLFPEGERFFVRSVHRYLKRIDDPELREAVRGFSQQEGRHANAHEQYFETLEKQGYEIRGFLRFYSWFAFQVLEKAAPPELRLAVTAAAEHYTATLAKGALGTELFNAADPTMAALLKWHAVEEVEHKSVAFDVLEHVNPSHRLRVAGMMFASALLAVFGIGATAMLLRQDRIPLTRIVREIRGLGDHNPFGRRVFGSAIRGYMRRGFHPDQETEDGQLATAYLAQVGMA
ncbi:MAG TPA: metal-dependent hydrolase [Polyangiaceae bacterium]